MPPAFHGSPQGQAEKGGCERAARCLENTAFGLHALEKQVLMSAFRRNSSRASSAARAAICAALLAVEVKQKFNLFDTQDPASR